MFPAASMARTEKMCPPDGREEKAFGELQATQMPASSLHWKREKPSVEENEKLALELVTVPLGPEPMLVFGGVMSVEAVPSLIIQLRLAGVGSTFPAASLART